MKREFYFQDDKSNKFWTIEVRGAKVVTGNGRVGAKPRETEHEYADADTAEAAARKEIAGKLKKGYVEGALAQAPAYAAPDWASMTMDDDTFWRLIALFNWKRSGDDDAVIAPAVKALAQMAPAQIGAFHDSMSRKLFALDTEAHARCIGEDAYSDDPDNYFSVDWFLYARCCVVANGGALYEAVLQDPSRFPKDKEFEALMYLALHALRLQTGDERDVRDEFPPSVSYETFSNRAGWAAAEQRYLKEQKSP